MCHRKKIHSIIEPVQMTNAELYNYIVGQASHDVIERHFMVHANRFRSEMEISHKNIRGRIDIYDKTSNVILEIKPSKGQQVPLRPWKFHEEQVKSYMAIMDVEEGQILYQLDNFRNYLPFPIYMTEEQRKEQLQKLENQAKSLQKAIDAGDPSLAEGIYEDREMKWMCNKCPYVQKCMNLRKNDAIGVGAAAVDMPHSSTNAFRFAKVQQDG